MSPALAILQLHTGWGGLFGQVLHQGCRLWSLLHAVVHPLLFARRPDPSRGRGCFEPQSRPSATQFRGMFVTVIFHLPVKPLIVLLTQLPLNCRRADRQPSQVCPTQLQVLAQMFLSTFLRWARILILLLRQWMHARTSLCLAKNVRHRFRAVVSQLNCCNRISTLPLITAQTTPSGLSLVLQGVRYSFWRWFSAGAAASASADASSF